MRKLDKYRSLTNDGWIFQEKKGPGVSYDAGKVWRPVINPDGRRRLRVNGKNNVLSRVMWEAYYGPIPDEMEIDHINGDKSDDSIVNLRCVSKSENNRGHKTLCGGTSKYRGVYWNKKDKVWMARAKHNGETHYFGSFNTEYDAAIARDEGIIKLGWPKEGLNFGEGPDHVTRAGLQVKRVGTGGY